MEKKGNTRKQQAQAMREHIRQTALALFAEYGFNNVSVEEIASAAGCSVGNIYHYFKNKDELHIQVTDHVDALYTVLEQEYAADETHTAMQQLLDFVGKSLQISVEDEMLYKSFVHALTFPEQGLLRQKPDRAWFRILAGFITRCQEEGSLPQDCQPEEILNGLVVIHRGMLMQYRIESGHFPLSDWGVAMARAYLTGLNQ